MTKQESLTKQSEADLKPYDYSQWEGEEDVLADDLAMPYIQIVQSRSDTAKEAGGEEGKFFSSLTGENYDSLRVIPLILRAERTKMSPYGGGEKAVLCKSSNALVPDEWVENPDSPVCARIEHGRRVVVCPSAQWDDGKPACSFGYVLLAVMEDGSPFIMRLNGMQVKQAKKLRSYSALRRAPLFAFACTLGLASSKTAYGSTYVLTSSDFTPVDPAVYGAMRDQLQGAMDRQPEPDDAQPDDAENATQGEDLPF